MAPSKITLEFVQKTDDVVWLIWEYVLAMSEHPLKNASSQQERDDFISSLPRGLQLVYYYTMFDGDVLNGGIRQFFYNSTPWTVKQTVLALEAFDAHETAMLLRMAISVYERYGWPHDSHERWLKLGWDEPDYAAEQDLKTFDDQRCADETSQRDYLLLNNFAHKHPALFVHG